MIQPSSAPRWIIWALIFLVPAMAMPAAAQPPNEVELFADPFEDGDVVSQQTNTISDPLYKFNRKAVRFNDRFYFKILRPTALGYKAVFPDGFRRSVRNFFMNLQEPIYFVNSLLQGRVDDAGAALTRLVVNSTVGFGGLADPVKKRTDSMKHTFDQTFAKWGFQPGFYIVWPFLGSSSVRGTIGLIGEEALDPTNYAGAGAAIGSSVTETVNETSYQVGTYEDIKKYSVNTYAALKDIYEKRSTRRRRRTKGPTGPFTETNCPSPSGPA